MKKSINSIYGIGKLIEDIKSHYGLSRAEIAEKTGYNANYISNAIKTGGNNKFLQKLQLIFPEIFRGKTGYEQPPLLNEEWSKSERRAVTIEDLALSIFEQQAMLKVLLTARVEDLASSTGFSYKKVLAEVELAIAGNLQEIKSQFFFPSNGAH